MESSKAQVAADALVRHGKSVVAAGLESFGRADGGVRARYSCDSGPLFAVVQIRISLKFYVEDLLSRWARVQWRKPLQAFSWMTV